MKTGGGASAPLPFLLRLYVVGAPKTGHKIWRRSGHLWVSQVNKRWRGRLPPSVRRYAVAACAPADAPPPPAQLDSPASPPPTAGRACAPPCGGRRLASRAGGCDLVGGWCRRRSVRCGGCPSLLWVRWCLPCVGAGTGGAGLRTPRPPEAGGQGHIQKHHLSPILYLYFGGDMLQSEK